MTVEEFGEMVADVRRLERALGDGQKRPTQTESAGRKLGRRSVHAAADIPAGAVLTSHMLKIVRPADGITPDRAASLTGRRAAR